MNILDNMIVAEIKIRRGYGTLKISAAGAQDRAKAVCQKAGAQCQRLYCLLEDRADAWDKRRMAKYGLPVCQKNFICDCQRRSCPGYTVSSETFWRRMKALERFEYCMALLITAWIAHSDRRAVRSSARVIK